MATQIPQDANAFIEQQLDERIHLLEESFDADAIGFVGDIYLGVDDLFRRIIEEKRLETPVRKKLVVILTTNGGYVNVVHRIVDTMRHYYDVVDFVVPNYAFSAGTVLVLSGDGIYMNYYSRLGPIDPQIYSTTTGRLVPALGYLEQWERLIGRARSGEITAAEVQLMIAGFDQAELYQIEQERDLSIKLLEEWLARYKFKNWQTTETRGRRVTDAMKRRRAKEIASELNNTSRWKSHGYGISMEELRRDLNLRIDDFESNETLGIRIKNYYNLLDDYMTKRPHPGVIHKEKTYSPFFD